MRLSLGREEDGSFMGSALSSMAKRISKKKQKAAVRSLRVTGKIARNSVV